jgi:hypothetical protein
LASCICIGMFLLFFFHYQFDFELQQLWHVRDGTSAPETPSSRNTFSVQGSHGASASTFLEKIGIDGRANITTLDLDVQQSVSYLSQVTQLAQSLYLHERRSCHYVQLVQGRSYVCFAEQSTVRRHSDARTTSDNKHIDENNSRNW